MAKQLNVNLAFTADTGAAKAQMMDLQRTLQSIAIHPTSFGGEKLTAEILEASKAAAQLSVQLKNATNVDTGTIDFSKLNQSMQKSGQSLASYGEKLMKLGPQGQEAFSKITSAVAKAEVPFRRSNKLVTEMWTTLKNTARWQLSSSILHGFMGALQSAYGYAQDLNESLNDIRIVTGYTTDQMADFAKQANASAKALSTTTNEYVKASLIYYQQGLSGKEIEERTNITIKMANVTKQSAQIVSDQLTAIWNNFDDGTKSLESYADAITALGAATASSTDEIAEGLEKFAAIADTVGLSFEYATAALATVTAETRQSADVVGTAFKTLFARLQDLELGNTLDDGTSLGKYSAAMAAVGVNIKDASGGLKEMDVILDELGGRWKSLSKDQQVALAQTVAGTRQYAQLIALMDNWDTMQTNLKTVEQSEGTIDLQHEKYAEGWEAASKRVRAALESIYEKLLDDDAFIGLLNGLEDIIGKVDFLVERLGGMKGTILMIGALVTQIFHKQIGAYINELSLSLQTLTKKGRQRLQEKKFAAMDGATAIVKTHAEENESADHAQAITNVYQKRTELQKELLRNAERFSDEEREALQILLDQNDALGQAVLEKQKAAKAAKENLDEKSNDLLTAAAASKKKTYDRGTATKAQESVKVTTQAAIDMKIALQNADSTAEDLEATLTQLQNVDAFTPEDEAYIKKLIAEFIKLRDAGEDTSVVMSELNGTMQRIKQGSKDSAADELGITLDEVDAYSDAIEEVADSNAELDKATQNFNSSADALTKDIQKGGTQVIDWGQKIVSTANAIMSVSSAISMLQSAWDTLSDPETTAWERLSTVFTTIAMVIPTLIMAWKSMSEVLNKETLATMASAIAKLFKAKASKQAAAASREEAGASNAAADAQARETATDVADGVVDTVKKGKGKGNKIFKGKSGDRWFANKYDKQGRPLDQKGQIIGRDNYAKAGLDDTGKLIKNKKSGFKLFGKGAGKAGGKAAAQAATSGGGQAATTAAAGGLKGIVAAAAPVAAIAAGVAIIAGTIALVVHQTQKWEKAAQEAEKRAVQAAEAYQSVADAYNEFSSNLDNYSNAKKGLEELTKGTKEYQQAVIEANESAMALIEAHEGLAYSVNNEGLIEIDQESLEAAEKEKLDNMQKAQMNKQMMAIEAREKRIKADSVELQRKELDSSQGTWTAIGNVAASTAAGAGAGALIGTGIGAMGAGAGAAPGAAIGAIVGAITGLVSGIAAQAAIGSAAEREQAAIDKVTALDPTAFASEEAYKAAVEELRAEIGDNGLVDSLKENYTAMKELAADVRANEAATNALNKQMVAAAVQDNETVQKGRHTEDVVAAAATFFEEDESSEMQKLIDDGWGTDGISKATKVNDEVERVFAEYAEAAGLEGAKVTDTTGTDKNRKFIYEIDGKEVEVSLEEMRTMVAKQKAAEASGLKAEQLTEIYNELNDAEAGAVTAAMTGDYSGLNLKQLQGETITAQTLGLSAEDLAVMGYESAEAFNTAMKEAQDKAAKGWENTLSNYSDTTAQLMRDVGNSSNEALQNITQTSVKAYGDMLEAIESAGGAEAAKGMSDGLMKLMEQHSSKAEEIMNAAASIDWSKGEASLNELNGKLFDMGIYIDENSEEWKAMVKSMEQINTSVVHRDLDSIRQEIVSIKEIAGSVEMGSVISDEDYARLVKYNGALKHMFAMTADGYMYVGGGNLEEEANKAALEQLEKTREDNAKAKAAHKALNAWGWTGGENGWQKEDWYGLANGTDSDTNMIKMTNALITNESDHLASLGFDAGYLAELTQNLETGTDDQKAKAREQLQKVYGEILALNANMENDVYDDTQAEEVYASTLTTVKDLEKAYSDNVISKETYNKYIKVLVRQEMQNAEDLNALEEAYGSGGEAGKTDNLEAYRENLQRLGEGYETAAEEVKAYQEAIESGSGVAAAEAALKNAILLGETAKDFGVNAEELEKLTGEIMANSNANFETALNQAVAYLKIAEEFGLSTEELQKTLADLTSGFSSLSAEGIDSLFKDIAAAAEETGIGIAELTATTISLGDRFNLTGAAALDMATLFAEASSEYGISTEELTIQTENIASAYDLSAKAAARLAVQNQRMNQGVATLGENWQDWKKTLKDTDKTSTDYAKAMAGLTDTVRDLVGAGEDFTMTSKFVEDNMALIEAAASGDEKAINQLGVATAKASVEAMEFSQEFADAMAEAANASGIDSPFENLTNDFLTNKEIVQNGIQELMNAVANGTIQVGDSMDYLGEDWITALNEMAIQTGMSVDEMNSLLNQMGVDADVTVTEVPTMTKVPVYRTEEKVVDDGSSSGLKVTETKTTVSGYDEMEGVMQVASINADAKVSYTGNGSVSTSSKTSGGGSTKKPDKADKKQSKDRYMKVTEQLDDTANAMADANREMDSLYGASRIAQMSKVNQLLSDEIGLLEDKTEEAKNYLKADKTAMIAAFSAAGAGALNFDASGNVSNIEGALDGLDAEYNSMVETYNGMIESFWADEVISADEQNQLDAYREQMDEKARLIDEARGAYDQYADTLNVIAETEDQILEKQNEIRANNFQRMTDNLNLALETTSAKTQEIDYYLNKIGDDFYKMAEAAALTGQKMDVATEVLALQKQHADGLAAAYEKGNITQADYVAGLKESRDAIYGELESLQSLDSEMQDYYGNTLSMAKEELGKHTERMDHLNSVLDHYQSLLSAIGKETDFKSMGVVLQGIADGAENSLAVAKAEYAFYKDQADQKKALMDSVPEDSAAFEVYKKEWEAAEAAARESQDNMLSATTEWAESMKAVIENELSDFAKTLEQQLTGGTSFDEMTTSIERAASLQEDYLTTTNKIYETTKMMRVAEKALDETTSTAAKNKLKGFIETTKQLQGQEKLSQFELDMQQKKYDLLLAEIALEEAQNAKSTVRLQRDAEGNFGYVYTADSNQVADAEQKVADAENALYNKGLEGANDYAQKYQSTMSEMYDTMTELQNAYLSGEITSQEEYDRRMLEAKDYYYQQLTNYSELYNVALGANTAIAQEAWSTEFASMTGSTEQWMAKVDEYTNNCGTSFQKWQGVVSEVQGVVGGNFDELATKVTAITNESNALVEAITKDGGVIDKLGDEVTAVSDTTKAYAEKRDTILEVIAAYEAYLKTINGEISTNSGAATVGDTTDNVPSVTPSGFDTGGYTGEWGPTGKLAVLHQKEIVLNAEDTENLLQTVGMVRTILQTIDMHSMSAQIGGILSTPGFHGGESGSLEQNVKIEASFPNVQDRNEIEEAFNNLINRASQYANH